MALFVLLAFAFWLGVVFGIAALLPHIGPLNTALVACVLSVALKYAGWRRARLDREVPDA